MWVAALLPRDERVELPQPILARCLRGKFIALNRAKESVIDKRVEVVCIAVSASTRR